MTLAEQWIAEGRAEGEARGEARGEAKGRIEGERRVLERLLRVKFGALPQSAAERLASVGEDDLTRWAERVLSATSIEETFR
jgi:predicted transposase YdaD